MKLTIQLAIIHAFAALWEIKLVKMVIVLKYGSRLSDNMYFDWNLEYKSKFKNYESSQQIDKGPRGPKIDFCDI